jgi:hypothetical protein
VLKRVGVLETLRSQHFYSGGRRCQERPGVEPVVLLGVSIFQFLERIPDRQAVEMVKYHLGWKLALNLSLNDRGFHSTTLVNFRQRLLENDKAHVAFQTVLEAAAKGRFNSQARQAAARFDSRPFRGARYECFGVR